MNTKINLEIESKLHGMTNSELIRQVYCIGSTNEYGKNLSDVPRWHGEISIGNGKDIYEALVDEHESAIVLSQYIRGELYEIYDGTRKLFSRELKEALDSNLKLISNLENLRVYTMEENK